MHSLWVMITFVRRNVSNSMRSLLRAVFSLFMGTFFERIPLDSSSPLELQVFFFFFLPPSFGRSLSDVLVRASLGPFTDFFHLLTGRASLGFPFSFISPPPPFW